MQILGEQRTASTLVTFFICIIKKNFFFNVKRLFLKTGVGRRNSEALEGLRGQGVNNSERVNVECQFFVEKIHPGSFESVAWFSMPFWK